MCAGRRPKRQAPPPPNIITPPTALDAAITGQASEARERASRGGRQSTVVSALSAGTGSTTTRTVLGG